MLIGKPFNMAQSELRHHSNVSGPLFADSSCIDCGTCYHIAPELFHEEAQASFVQKQPSSIIEWQLAKNALLSCPTNSIGVEKAPPEFQLTPDSLPQLITDEIYYCGYTARSSFGASSYLIVREEGNFLVDSPRFNTQLVKKIEALGGVSLMLLTHRDDVADHTKFAEHFKCSRVIHELEVDAGTSECETILQGEGDWEIAPQMKGIFTPGHTAGHVCFLYKSNILFAGDHLFYSRTEQNVYASQNVNWYSWEEQQASIRKLLTYEIDWILPGHGGWIHLSPEAIRRDLRTII
jgi:glyoxylase-like metal-dependent hydrolase (beta-lactamase superfamily II)/ferredoxin